VPGPAGTTYCCDEILKTALAPWVTINESQLEGEPMEDIVERCAALDLHKETIMAAVRLPGEKGKRRTEVRQFRIWTSSLRELRSWLVGQG
jgi:hypothetical protein